MTITYNKTHFCLQSQKKSYFTMLEVYHYHHILLSRSEQINLQWTTMSIIIIIIKSVTILYKKK